MHLHLGTGWSQVQREKCRGESNTWGLIITIRALEKSLLMSLSSNSVTISLCRYCHKGFTVVTRNVVNAISVCEIQYSMWAACDKHTGEERKIWLSIKENTDKKIKGFTSEKSAK